MMLARCLRCKAPRGLLRVAGSSLSVQQKGRREATAAEHTTAPAEPPQTHTARGFDVGLLVSVLRQENASDICVIRVSPELRYTDHMIIVSGSSPRHLSAMAAFVLKAFKSLRKNEEQHVRLEGRDCDDWKCIDFGSMVLHLMLSDTRDTYELEKLWTLRSHDEQLQRVPQHTLPSDFILDMQNN